MQGDSLVILGPLHSEPPAATYATFDTRNAHPVLDFAVGEATHFAAVLPQHYAGGGIEVYLHFAASSATIGNGKWETSIERIGDGSQDLDADGFAAAQNTGDVAVPATSGNVTITNTTHTAGAQMDSLAVGELFRVKVARVAAGASEAAGDLELVGVEIREA